MSMTNQTYRHHLLQRRDLALRAAIDSLDLLIKEAETTKAMISQAHENHARTGNLDNGAFWQTFRATLVALNQIQMLDSIPGIKPGRLFTSGPGTLQLKNGATE